MLGSRGARGRLRPLGPLVLRGRGGGGATSGCAARAALTCWPIIQPAPLFLSLFLPFCLLRRPNPAFGPRGIVLVSTFSRRCLRVWTIERYCGTRRSALSATVSSVLTCGGPERRKGTQRRGALCDGASERKWRDTSRATCATRRVGVWSHFVFRVQRRCYQTRAPELTSSSRRKVSHGRMARVSNSPV